MVFTDYGRSGTALLFAGSVNLPRYLGIGTGSGTAVASLGSLVTEVGASRTDFTSRDIGTMRQCSFVFDVNSISMSGVLLTEFGIGGSQAITTNDLWVREAFPSITFDGSNELEVTVTFLVF